MKNYVPYSFCCSLFCHGVVTRFSLRESPGSLHKLAPDIPRRVVTGTSHWPHLDKPEEFNRLLDAFLANIS